MGKAQIGFLQELQTNGQIANSFIRKISAFFFGLLVMYMFFSNKSYEDHFSRYVQLLQAKALSQESFITLTMQLKRIEDYIFLILILAVVAPKVIQKFAEAKTGIKDTSESTTTTTTSSDKSSTTPIPPAT